MIAAATCIHPRPYGRNKALEEKTGIRAHKWANFFNGKQKPTLEMIEAVCKLKPEWVVWLLTGVAGGMQSAPDNDAQDLASAPSPEETKQNVLQFVELLRKLLLKELDAEKRSGLLES